MGKVRAHPKWTVPGSSGAIASGWKVNTYIAGTSTRKDTYTDYLEGSANTNPVILDSRGEADIWWAGTYKVVVTDENDVIIWTVDNYGQGEDQVQTGNFNLILNGSFETDEVSTGEPDNWTIVDYTDGVHSLDATDQLHGLNSLKFVSIGTGGGYATSEYFEVQEAKIVAISWAMKSSVADVRNVVDILWHTSAKTLISTTNIYDDSATNPTSWTAKNGTGTPPSTARYAQVRVYGCHSSDATSGSTWFDDVQAIDDLAATQAEVDAGTVTDRYVAPATLVAYTPVSPTNYVGGIEVHIDNDVGGDTTTFVPTSAIASSTWESVGPTGSGATNIWTAMDSIPARAVAVLVKVSSSIQGATLSSTYTVSTYGRVTGSSTGAVFGGLIARTSFINQVASAGGVANVSGAVPVPIDSVLRFDVEWVPAGTSPTSVVTMVLVGWIE